MELSGSKIKEIFYISGKPNGKKLLLFQEVIFQLYVIIMSRTSFRRISRNDLLEARTMSEV